VAPDWLVHFDGASRNNGSAVNPTLAGVGVCVWGPGGLVREESRFLGEASNNEAEFTALVVATRLLSVMGAKCGSILLRGDSELAVLALRGERSIKAPKLRLLLAQAKVWLATVGAWTVTHVPRAGNGVADALANLAIDGRSSDTVSLGDLVPVSWATPSPGVGRMVRFVEPLAGGSAGQGFSPGAPPPAVHEVLSGARTPSPSDIWLPDVSQFVAGNLHAHHEQWAQVVSNTANGRRVAGWAKDKVRVSDFFCDFSGVFQGRHYSGSSPPRAKFPNHGLPSHLSEFVGKKIGEAVVAGAVRVWGEVGVVDPPHLVLPIGVEPSKPRMLHDARFLNLWCMSIDFKFEGLHMLPDLMEKGEFGFNIDHTSGYWHIALSEESCTYFGFEWNGVYYVYLVLSFGWSPAPEIYSCFSGEVAGFLRRLGIRYLYFLDDSLGGQLDRFARGQAGFDSACSAAYTVVCVMVGLGYFVHPTKSTLVPAHVLEWLGMTVNFLLGSFALPARKRAQIQSLAQDISSSKSVAYKTLERFVGKCNATMVAVPGALLRCRQSYAALALESRKAGRPGTRVVVSPALAREVGRWECLDEWGSDSSPWKSAFHVGVVVSAPPPFRAAGVGATASGTWAGMVRASCFSPVARGSVFARVSLERDGVQGDGEVSWASTCSTPLLAVLTAGVQLMDARNCFVDVVVSSGWRPSSVFGSDLSLSGGERVAEGLFALVVERGLVVSVVRSPDESSVADMWRSDRGSYVLSREIFARVEMLFGPHSVDAMASDENAQWVPGDSDSTSSRWVDGGILRIRERAVADEGNVASCPASMVQLPHFSRFPSGASSGVNVLAQPLGYGVVGNIYCNAVFAMIAALVRHFRAEKARVSLIVPGWVGSFPSGHWWPVLVEFAKSWTLLAGVGTPGVFLQLREGGGWTPAGPVPYDIWLVRLDFS
jgi:ribonuclease HI